MTDGSPFSDLPAALVEEVLAQTQTVSQRLLDEFNGLKHGRRELRENLESSGLLLNESELGYPPQPTTCAADGSYAIERLLTTDLVAAAAVAVEGLTPPSEKRFWPTPRHKTFIAAERHLESTGTVLRAVMLGRELELATGAPHELVLIDGTLTLPIIYFNQALNQAPSSTELACSREFIGNAREFLISYQEILSAKRSDKQFAGLPKYSTRREVGLKLGWPASTDDRGLLTLLMNSGELSAPTPIEQPRQPWHFSLGQLPNEMKCVIDEISEHIIEALRQIYVFYYKPHAWLPALRVEVASGIATSPHRLAVVVQGLKHQCATPSMLEPYPIYLADRTVKALAKALPAFRQVTTQHIAEDYAGDIGEVYFAMHGYRSDTGR